MNVLSRPLAILAAAAVGGAGLWLAGHWDMDTNGGYWAALGVAALVGMMIGLAQLRSPTADAPGMVVAWIAITVAAGWVLVFDQPVANSFRDHIREWSADLGIADVVHYVSPFMTVLAFAIGLVFGLTMLAGWAMQRDADVVDEPTAVTPVPTRMTAPPPMVAARPATETEAAEEPTVVGNGSRRREILLVP